MVLDEQTQIDMLSESVSEIGESVEQITKLLIGDKLNDPNARSLIDDVSDNTKFRNNINKKFNALATTFFTGVIAILTKQFWMGLLGIDK